MLDDAPFIADGDDDTTPGLLRSARAWQGVPRNERVRTRALTKAMAIDDDAEFHAVLQGLYASDLDDAQAGTRAAFIVRELLTTERSYARHLARLVKVRSPEVNLNATY
jgi:hypothetical protein